MNPELVPSPDMLGLPLSPWILRALSALTLAAHWSMIGGAVGGTALMAAEAWRARRSPGGAKLGRAIVSYILFAISIGVTFGIAPLLFVQVLYGNLFYSANVLMAYWWLAIVPLAVGGTYLVYFARQRLKSGRGVHPGTMAAALAIFILLAAILVSITVLSQNPEAWQGMYRWGGAAFYADGAAFRARLALALCGLLTAGGLFVALLGKLHLLYDAEAEQLAVSQGLRLASVAILAQLVAGAAVLAILPENQRQAVAGGGEAAYFYVAVAAGLATAVLAGLARRRPTRMKVVLAGLAYFIGLVALALARDVARQAAVAPVFRVPDIAVNPQWGPFAVFLAFLVGGVAVLVWLVRLARGPRPEAG
jgi:hypothetical protein